MTDDVAALLDALWANYTEVTPGAAHIHAWLAARGDVIINDHVALRTFGIPGIDRAALARPFEALGWQRRDTYWFADKHLVASYWQHADAGLPKIFISELVVDEMPDEVQIIIHQLVAQVSPAARGRADLPWSGRPWQVSYGQYAALLGHSEYAAWVAAFGFRVNHFTVLVNALRSVRSLRQLVAELTAAGFVLAAHGGVVKGTPEDLLEQASTHADAVPVAFSDRSAAIPSCYYEFAERHRDAGGELFHGFVPASANQLFHSTDAKPAAKPSIK